MSKKHAPTSQLDIRHYSLDIDPIDFTIFYQSSTYVLRHFGWRHDRRTVRLAADFVEFE
jgi:hypothetical protein